MQTATRTFGGIYGLELVRSQADAANVRRNDYTFMKYSINLQRKGADGRYLTREATVYTVTPSLNSSGDKVS